jgi:xanthine dehydrogenase YagT iron-sulfur-binding subunit
MSEENTNRKKISRRNFITKTGTGIVGSYFLASSLKNVSAKTVSPTQPLWVDEKRLVTLHLKVNGQKVRARVTPETTLADLLRNDLHLKGTKVVCGRGECGGCTVVMDDKAVYSCHTLALEAEGKEVTTIEGLLDGEKLHPVQEAFVEEDGFQCGFCTPGQIMAAYGLLLKNPKPNAEQIRYGMSGNICRCSAYPKIVKSVQTAAKNLK